MKTTTAGFKSIMSSGAARNYVIKVDLTLADNTVLHLTEADIWQDSFGIETASSGTSSFDIGTAVIGKCSFTINNIDGDFDNYDFFNATAVVWLGLEGDTVSDVQQYYRMGFYTVDEPQKANGLISLELLDNMWKFDVPFSSVTINYPATALAVVQAMCSYCGVSLAGTSASFHGYNFSIAEAPKDAENMNCREMLQYVAMLGCNFCTINPTGYLEIKWYDVNATASTTDVFDYNKSTSFGTEDIEITGVKFVIDDTAYTAGSAGYVLELENPLVTASNVSAVLNLIWATGYLKDFTLRTFNANVASDLAAEIGDKVKIRDYQGNYVYSWLTTNSFKLAGHVIKCDAETPNRTLVKRYSKAVQAAVQVAREAADEQISNYDLAVQMMNELAVNAMGGYEDYEDLQTGGRVWYLSNMPITKTGGVCSFEPNSVVYKKSGDGFFVSRDGGQTWVNGYNISTGELVVNVLDAIGINFDWARGGTLTLGGYGNGNGVLSILNSSNVEKIHGDNTGISAGSNGQNDSKVKLTVDGKLEYYYGNSYEGQFRMTAENRGTEQEPEIVDYLSVEDFSHIGVGNSGTEEIWLEAFKEHPSHAYIQNARISVEEDAERIEYNAHLDNPEDYACVDIVANGIDEDDDWATSEIMVCGNGHTYLDTRICPDVDYLVDDKPCVAQDEVLTVLSENNKEWQNLIYRNGMLVLKQNTGRYFTDVHDTWHTWESGGVTYTGITLSAGVSQADFPSIDTSATYEPYIQVASGQPAPMIEGVTITGTTYSVRFETITQAQAAGGACVIKLCKRGITY